MIKLVSLVAKGFKQLDIDRLDFPSKGTVLIVGRNESGKSTLFEAIYFSLFGEGLVPSRGPKGLPDLLGYKREKGMVSLTVSVGETLLEITRILKRKGIHEHKLRILSPRQETITGARAVNERIERELKLDGDAILNSCFVEQKNLEKLETLKSDERQRTIARLLNIENFKEMEDGFKEEAKRLAEERQREQKKLELALMLEEIPLLVEERKDVDRRLKIIEMKKEREDLRQRAEENQERIRSTKADISKLEKQLSDIEAIERELTKKNERHTALGSLKETLEQYNSILDGIREIRENIARKNAEIEHLHDLEQKRARLKEEIAPMKLRLEEEKKVLEGLSHNARLFKQRRLLLTWEMAKKAEDELALLDEKETEIHKKRRIKETNLQDFSQMKKLEGARLMIAIVFSAISSLLSASFLLWVYGDYRNKATDILFFGKILAIVLFLISLMYNAFHATQIKRKLIALSFRIEEAQTAIAVDEGELKKIEGMKELTATRGRIEVISLADVEKEMKAENISFPSSLAECRGLIEDVTGQTSHLDENEVTREYEKSTNNIGALTASIAEKERMMHSLQGDIEKKNPAALQKIIGALTKEEEYKIREARAKNEVIEKDAQALKIEPDFKVAMDAHSRLSEEISSDRKTIARKDELTDDRKEKERQSASLETTLLAQEKRMSEIEVFLKGDPSADETDIVQEAPLRQERDQIVGKLTTLENNSRGLQEFLGITHVDRKECERATAHAQRNLSVNALAHKIVTKARKQIEANVLPRIEDNMERFIPSLTSDRYKEVFINPADYKIEIMDEVAGERRPKSVFSGGTRDQLSLALRLSFALATLPEERGSSPSFIFLDEPIGAFDEERRNALIELLTIGEISESFDQIFIISHFSELEDVFEYKIKMDGGKVVEANL